MLISGRTSSPSNIDSDHDGVTDAQETTPTAIFIPLKDGPPTRLVTSDPHPVDRDADGIRDAIDGDPTANPGLALTDLHLTTNASGPVHASFAADQAVALAPNASTSLRVDIDDTSTSRTSLDVPAALLNVHDANGKPLDVVGDPRGSVVLHTDALAPPGSGVVTLHAADGSRSFSGNVTRT